MPLYAFIVRRALFFIPTLVGVSIIAFMMLHLTPGDPARLVAGVEASQADVERVREQLGLNRSLPAQYLSFVGGAVTGDLGQSIHTRRTVTEELGRRLPVSLTLVVGSTLFAAALGIFAGVVSATRQYSVFDRAAMIVSMLGISIPSFFLGILLLLLFAVKLRWVPVIAQGDWTHFILPIVSLGLLGASIIARMTRSSMLEVLREDYIRTAKAKGLSHNRIIFRHALRNALIPTVTVIGLQFGYLLGGAVVTENVFALSGLGRGVVDAILQRDFPVVRGTVLLLAALFAFVNLIVDVVYVWIDPRIRYT